MLTHGRARCKFQRLAYGQLREVVVNLCLVDAFSAQPSMHNVPRHTLVVDMRLFRYMQMLGLSSQRF